MFMYCYRYQRHESWNHVHTQEEQDIHSQPPTDAATSSSDVPYDGWDGGGGNIMMKDDDSSGDAVSGPNLYDTLEVAPTCPMTEVTVQARLHTMGAV